MKTIKRERQVRLDELVSYIIKNEVVSSDFESNRGSDLVVDINGDLNFYGKFNYNDIFTITEEVEIDYDTILDLIAVRKVGTVSRFENRSIQGVLVHFEGEVDYIYFQNPDGSIGDLIWLKERGLVD
ncbi:hypothetical protein [Macrococcoides canis]|uniref:hypothetical protein n=1 Tax=Macrococcoides canis TaxID=1855823 RepID=UPI0022B895F1|nr:hypothetical protein [Macrococcus canis]WBF53796.1 hypothetical protein LL975_05760 [Macrococcus canis]